SAWIAGVVLGLLIVGGLIWLASALASPAMIPVVDVPLATDRLLEAQGLLDAEGIASRVESGKLLVPRGAVRRVRAMLGREGLLPQDDPDAFARIAEADDIWSTQSGSVRRWQAAKMATLGRLLCTFPQVRSATVLFEPGASRRLGSPGVEPTAAVRVVLKPRAQMTPRLVEAIADLVSGSISGMTPQNVCIVDSTGRSHRVRRGPAGDGPMDALRAAEAYYAGKIETALSYIDNVIVDVRVAAEQGGGYRCAAAWVSIPRSYLQAIGAADKSARPGQPAEPDSFVSTAMKKMQQAAARAIGASSLAAVTMDWHYDVPQDLPAAAGSGEVRGPADRAGWTGRTLAGGALLAVAAGCSVWILPWLRRRRSARRSAPRSEAAQSGRSAVAGPAIPSGTWDILELMSAEDLLRFLEGEHPQTIAMVLSRLSSDKAGSILSGLVPDRQVDVSRRIADLDGVDDETVREVEEALAAQLRSFVAAGPAPGRGEARLAELLQRAGLETERNVIRSLTESQPALAESLRGRMFTFEEIASLPSGRLREALEATGSAELALALRTAGKETRRKVLSVLSGAAGRRVRAEMERIGPVRLSDVEAAQQRVVERLHRTGDEWYVAETGRQPNDLVV
ncbi:MAG TPA: FliG C-terminal domain-containing protein, partial [Phycisphaerae bacterium]|nr:FliG C-terminal domain-containing protein [Phycisphaerae bacterium]